MKRFRVLIMLAAMLLAVAGCEKKGDTAEAEAPAEKTEGADKEGSDESGEEGAAEEAGDKGDEKETKKGAAAPADGDKETAKATVGEPAPPFTLTDEAGEKHNLADYKGKLVVLEWTNPDCPYVQRHYKAETMQTVYEKGGKDDIVWLAIDSSYTVKAEDSKKWKKEQGFGYPVLQDPEGKVGKVYGAKTTPHMFVIDKEGVIRYSGAIDNDPRGTEEEPVNFVDQAVSALLDDKEVEKKSTKPYGCSVKYSG